MSGVHSSIAWTCGKAPRDGKLFIAMGRILATDEHGGYSMPFLSRVRWGGSTGWSGWVDEQGMAISSDLDAEVHIDHWIGLPPEDESHVKAGEEVAA